MSEVIACAVEFEITSYSLVCLCFFKPVEVLDINIVVLTSYIFRPIAYLEIFDQEHNSIFPSILPTGIRHLHQILSAMALSRIITVSAVAE